MGHGEVRERRYPNGIAFIAPGLSKAGAASCFRSPPDKENPYSRTL